MFFKKYVVLFVGNEKMEKMCEGVFMIYEFLTKKEKLVDKFAKNKGKHLWENFENKYLEKNLYMAITLS